AGAVGGPVMAPQPPRDGRRKTGGAGRSADENVVPFRPREPGGSREAGGARPREARSRLSEAQQYHPRGRTVREGAEPTRTPRQSAAGSGRGRGSTGAGKSAESGGAAARSGSTGRSAANRTAGSSRSASTRGTSGS